MKICRWGVYSLQQKTKNNPHENRQETGGTHHVHPEPVRAKGNLGVVAILLTVFILKVS